jgi:Flp pilus assembly protein TadB
MITPDSDGPRRRGHPRGWEGYIAWFSIVAGGSALLFIAIVVGAVFEFNHGTYGYLGVIDALLALNFLVWSMRLRRLARRALAERRPCPGGFLRALTAMQLKSPPGA